MSAQKQITAAAALALAARAVPFLRDEAANHDDDGSNEPLELALEIEAALGAEHVAPAEAKGVSPLDLSAPPRVFLQVDVTADAEDRDDPIERDTWELLTWHHERIGGQEIEYIRADLATTPQPADGGAVAWQSMATAPRDGTVIHLRWGQDGISPGWWSAPVSPIQNEDGTWPTMSGYPWAFVDKNNGRAFVNHARDNAYGPTHWAPYDTTPQPAQVQQEAVDVESALEAGDPNWRAQLRPNLTGNEQLWYAVRDIAELRRFLAGEAPPLPGTGLAVVRVGPGYRPLPCFEKVAGEGDEPMSLAVALDFADNPRPRHTLAAPADTNGELYRALRVIAAAHRATHPAVDALGAVDGWRIEVRPDNRDGVMGVWATKDGASYWLAAASPEAALTPTNREAARDGEGEV